MKPYSQEQIDALDSKAEEALRLCGKETKSQAFKRVIKEPCRECGRTFQEMSCSMRYPPDEKPICFDCELMKTPKVVLEKFLSVLTNKLNL